MVLFLCFDEESPKHYLIWAPRVNNTYLEAETVFDKTAVSPDVIRPGLLVKLQCDTVVEGGDFAGGNGGVS